MIDPVDGFLRDHRALIIDRDSKFTQGFRETLRHAVVQVVLTPYMAPNANAFAERFVLSIKRAGGWVFRHQRLELAGVSVNQCLVLSHN